MSDYERAYVVHWLVMKLGMALFIFGAIPAVAAILAAALDDWSWMAMAGLGPVGAGVYLIFVKPPIVFDDETPPSSAKRLTQLVGVEPPDLPHPDTIV